jgi:hypothetical protein
VFFGRSLSSSPLSESAAHAPGKSNQTKRKPADTGGRQRKSNMLNETGNTNEVGANAEAFLRLWKEQCNNARRYLIDGLKRQQEKNRFRAEGVHFLLLSLKDYLTALPSLASHKEQVEAEFLTFLNLLEQF